MTIRNKLLVLLLTVGLIPLLTISVLHQIAIRHAGTHISRKTEEALNQQAIMSLENLIKNCNKVLERDRNLIKAIIKRQAREVEIRLSQAQPTIIEWREDSDYGFNPDLEELSHFMHDYFTKDNESKEVPLEISYRRQGYFLAKAIERADVEDDMYRLWSMTDVYHELYNLMPGGILWHYTTLENGLHTSYPSGGELPDPNSYDPRKRNWYLTIKEEQDIVRIGPIIDAATGQVIITIAAPVFKPDGSFAGVTAIDRTLSDILESMKLPHRWAEGAERFMVVYRPQQEANQKGKLEILLQASYADGPGSWQSKIELQMLESQDFEQFNAMIQDIGSGIAGVRKMEYNGSQALWAYGDFSESLPTPLIIVPYEKVVEFADSMESFLLKDNLFWLEIASIGIVLVVGSSVVLAAVRARAHTKPIYELTEANQRLSAGDYNARVEITTGDELQELGQIFNQTGPKLKEHEKMQRSLELAKAIQQHLIPRESPKLKNFEISVFCRYCDQTGGDYYDFIEFLEMEPGKLGVALGDVSGHGIGAALLMATARSILRGNAVRYKTNLSKLFDDINIQLLRDTEDDKFITLFYGILDDRNKSLIWASGGHDPALWYHKDTDKIEELLNTGMPVGLMENATFEQDGPVVLKSGDMIVIGTDGIWEGQNKTGNMFGKKRFYELVSEYSDLSPSQFCSKVIEEVMKFTDSAPQMDDITLVVIKAL